MKQKKFKFLGVSIALLLCSTGFSQASQPQPKVTSELDTIVVSASRTAESLRNVSQNITVITAEDIERSSANSMTELLKKIGIQTYSDGSESYGNDGVVIRGGKSSMHGFDIAGDILVLVDGHRTGSDFLASIGLGNTERIEVIRGPGSVQYGAAAMGGVINVITKRGSKTQGSVEAGVGSWNEQRYKAAVSGQEGQLDYAFAARYYTREEYTLGNGEKFENSDVKDRINYSLNAGWNFNPNHRLGLIVQGAETNDAGKGEDGSSRYNYDSRQDRDNHTIDLSYEGQSETGTTSWLARYFMGEVNYDLKRFTSSSTTQLPYSKNTNEFKGAQLQVGHDFGLFHTVTGLDYMAYELDQRQTGEAASERTRTTAQSDYDNLGAFVLGELHMLENKNLILSAGMRYDEFDVSVDAHRLSSDERVSRDIDKHSWTPSVGIAYSPIDILKMRASYARAFKMPLPRQLTGYTVMMSTPFIGNPDLDPETSDNFDIGFDLDWNAMFFSATWFYSDYKDKIGYETRTGDPDINDGNDYYWYYNVDSAEIQGIELGIKFDIARYLGHDFKLEPYLFWTHLLTFEDNEGEKLKDRARDTVSAGIVYSFAPIGLTAGLDATHYGEVYDSGNEKYEDVGDVWVVDLNATKRLYEFKKYGDIRLKASIRNLFDEYYANSSDSWMPGRSFYMGLEFTY